MPVRTVTADRGDSGRRLDHVLCRHLANVDAITRTRIQTWIRDGQVAVNGTPVRRVAARIVQEAVISIALPPAKPRRRPAPENLPLDVVYEDDYLLAVDKPAGTVVHPAFRHTSGTLMNALLWRARAWPAGSRPSIVGRLDKLTSGLVLVARTAVSHAALQRALAAGEKDYLAVVYGRVSAARVRIDLRLSRDPRDRRRVIASTGIGRPSLTWVERLDCADVPRASLSLLRCRLATGRMHQIRVHLASRGWPIVGDPVYGRPKSSAISDPALAAALQAFPRQALHAWRVAFIHPFTGERVALQAPLPRDIERLLNLCGLSAPHGSDKIPSTAFPGRTCD